MARELSQVAKKFTEVARQAMKGSAAIGLLGFDVELVEPGRSVLRLDVKPHHRQIHGVVHGGIVAALADTAGGMAAYSVVPRGTAVATVELKINYLEAVPGGRLTAEARILRTGRNFVVAECDVVDGKGKLVAKALLTFGAAGGHSLDK
jgi:uncharacterized protein (TIGR00369 family)